MGRHLDGRARQAATIAAGLGVAVAFDGFLAVPEVLAPEGAADMPEFGTPRLVGPEGDRVFFFRLPPDGVALECVMLGHEAEAGWN